MSLLSKEPETANLNCPSSEFKVPFEGRTKAYIIIIDIYSCATCLVEWEKDNIV